MSTVGTTVNDLIVFVYGVHTRQISGAPAWVESDKFDIRGKPEGGRPNPTQFKIMLQKLLADRFQLAFHRDMKQLTVYALMVDKSGSKMKVNDSPQDFEIPILGGPGRIFNGKRVPMEYLCYFLGQILRNDDRQVIDKTGLKGYYDFTLSFMPELPAGFEKANLTPELLDRPTIFDALRTQLGLRLDAQKGTVEYYVIDHVEKPAEN